MYLHGRNVLRELLKVDSSALKIKRIVFTNQKNVDSQLLELAEESKARGFRIEEMAPEKLANLCREKKHQGVVIDLKQFPYSDSEELLGAIEEQRTATIVLLDQIQDPHNLGAIIRTSVAAGVDAIAVTSSNSAEITPSVVKVSAGLAFKIQIIKIINMAQFEEILKEKGFWIYASDMKGTPYYENEYSEKSAIVFGNEGKGVRRLVKERSDRLISIPMEDTVDSLNVAASAAIILFDRRRQLSLGGE
ncbi:MAG: 23S rRNA (guanosine(2251)-2'-O)-methyltransferase RlmB [Thermotogae bacterium]|jgi:23S rRNA (guanosine2251-2'-O)-methyltransferase|nr:23S rRNA (guanosine(2251)-2'-O)-methyltransferase RlmB [Thermotogota bacterium]MCP5461102.1 23S rRNA (guanosine(2251)-2'-O)-methyltransferase RlmB [Thermotogota bacterium]CCU84252.1 RNA methyltransferase, TrmH family, group 3 [Mesotoga infera]